jgi:PHD/YefM family antitoxin component YafN of YafNO toxin-antitoxin module
MAVMSKLPAGDGHDVIHLGGETAVVVPMEEYRRLRELERRTLLLEKADAEEAAALAEYRAQQQAGTVVAVPQGEVRRRFGLAAQ